MRHRKISSNHQHSVQHHTVHANNIPRDQHIHKHIYQDSAVLSRNPGAHQVEWNRRMVFLQFGVLFIK